MYSLGANSPGTVFPGLGYYCRNKMCFSPGASYHAVTDTLERVETTCVKSHGVQAVHHIHHMQRTHTHAQKYPLRSSVTLDEKATVARGGNDRPSEWS